MQRGVQQVMPQIVKDWVKFMMQSNLGVAVAHQDKYLKSVGNTFSYSGFDLMDLVIFTSNIIRHFREMQKNKLPFRTSSDAFEVIEKEYDLVFEASGLLESQLA